jgi:hypothetical protein
LIAGREEGSRVLTMENEDDEKNVKLRILSDSESQSDDNRVEADTGFESSDTHNLSDERVLFTCVHVADIECARRVIE